MDFHILIANNCGLLAWKFPSRMLITPYIMRLVYLCLLAVLVNGKGGGGKGASKGTSKGSKGSTSRKRPIIIVNNGGHKECRDSVTNQIVKCPPDKKAGIIAGAVIGGVVGLILIGGLVWWCRRRRNRGHSVTRALNVPLMSTRERKEYKHLGSEHGPSESKDKDVLESKTEPTSLSTMDNGPLGGFIHPIPVPPVAFTSSAGSSKSSGRDSVGNYSRQSLKSLDRLLGDHRDPRKLQKLVHKLYDNLKFEKDRADYADRRASEAIAYLRTICEEKLRATREISRLEEELKLYKIQYEEAQKEIFRAQGVIGEVDERRFQAEKEAADARSAMRKMRDQINVMNAQDEGRRQGLEEGFRKGREMGYREGLRMAESELENIARTGPPVSSSADAEMPPHSSAASQTLEPQIPPRHSRAPSNIPSRPPTAPPETPSSPSVLQATIPSVNQPVQPVSEMPEEPEVIRPRSVRALSPSPHIQPSAIPPDNFIPHLEEDNRIRLPPPHEFGRLPPSPEPSVAPALAGPAENEEPRMIPPKVSTNFRAASGHRSTSPTSASTTLSHMDMITDPYDTGRSPMSVIPESLSQEGSPDVRGAASLGRQPSLGAQSARLMGSNPGQPIYTRPRTTSGASSISFQPPVVPDADPRTSVSTTSSAAPNIMVLPPSASGAGSGEFSSNPRSRPIYGNPNMDSSGVSFISPIPEADSQPAHRIFLRSQPSESQMPSMISSGHMPGDLGYGPENTSGDSRNPPVIPHLDLYDNIDEEGDAVSSGFGSEDSLTTPPTKQEKLPSRAGSIRGAAGSALSHQAGGAGARSQMRAGGSQAGPSRAGSAVGAAADPNDGGAEEGYQPDWGEVYRSTFSVPLRFPQLPPDLQSASGRAPSRASSKRGKGSVLSMSSSRNGQ
ncbi:hypothetical protein D9756_007488 [Leucocoprinus leucothites]|uniref:Uncharacterized protein n=1 Tax=Leucocoprinus leucothites TaxID=201217 RepID=A0A8H5D269_9AGAR|nr:hypothetical protein D9756_007488 [Leucoagaricus leucothites]